MPCILVRGATRDTHAAPPSCDRHAPVALCWQVSSSMIGSGAKITDTEDPTLFCAAFKKSRFFLFTRREPEDPDGDDQVPSPFHTNH